MAKRTIKSKYEAQDATLSGKRQLLSVDRDRAEIYYEVDPYSSPAESASDSSNETSNPPPPYTASVPETSEASRPSPPSAPGRTNAGVLSSKKPDAPISALEIIVGIIAQKLKKSSDEIAATSTIKSLVSGGFPRLQISRLPIPIVWHTDGSASTRSIDVRERDSRRPRK
ncbi:hypothetical protein M430DRAFT_33877 [Amorphotheca resinae ATCC 22711]|uniref:Uncharacterized protein n=1 Tax=Amorphotheca resinae ATCC 22711 TaxID=857342 RepID=A0A2T3B929_AMORE|nr:hypothetical protein M430DRAFT_33877 [Amorphotheca resinae ATCC 22711]PSS23380.1 hypothetical protein M430DRAFT_33877 [Amorphotheca resinae ATCC 22711]